MRALPTATILLLACCGCTAATTASSARLAFAVESQGPACWITGPTRIVEANVFGREASTVVRDDGNFEVALLDEVTPCLHVAFTPDGRREGTVLGDCPSLREGVAAMARNELETYRARPVESAGGEAHIMLGAVVYDWPHMQFGVALPGRAEIVEHRFVAPPGGPGGGESVPALAAFGDGGFLLVWIEGNSVRGVPLARGAETMGTAIDLSPLDADEIGPPSLAFRPDGSGLVSFTAHTPTGHHVLATPVACNR